MNAFNPITTLQRLEGAGFKRAQSEALANELHHATTELVTKDELAKALDAQANKVTLRIGALIGAALPLVVVLSKLIA